MNTTQSRLVVDLGSNPGVAAMFAGKGPGDVVELSITASVLTQNAQEAICAIMKVEGEGEPEETPENAAGEAIPDADSPVGIVLGRTMGMRGKE